MKKEGFSNMKSKIRNLMMIVAMACMCVCMSGESVKAAAYSVTGEMIIVKGLTCVDDEGARKKESDKDAQVKPNNGLPLYVGKYLSVYVVLKNPGYNVRATDGVTCMSDEKLFLEYYNSQISTSRVYYLAASVYPNDAAFGTFKYTLTP